MELPGFVRVTLAPSDRTYLRCVTCNALGADVIEIQLSPNKVSLLKHFKKPKAELVVQVYAYGGFIVFHEACGYDPLESYRPLSYWIGERQP